MPDPEIPTVKIPLPEEIIRHIEKVPSPEELLKGTHKISGGDEPLRDFRKDPVKPPRKDNNGN